MSTFRWGVNLGDLVLDIHEGTRDRQRIAADLGATLDLAEHATAPDTAALHRRLTDRQQRLRRHAAALHRVHEPWRLSAYQIQSALLGVPDDARVSARLAVPEEITPGLADDIRDELAKLRTAYTEAVRADPPAPPPPPPDDPALAGEPVPADDPAPPPDDLAPPPDDLAPRDARRSAAGFDERQDGYARGDRRNGGGRGSDEGKGVHGGTAGTALGRNDDEREYQPDKEGPADVAENESGQGQAAALLSGPPDLP